MPVSRKGILWISSDKVIEWRQKTTPLPPSLYIFFPHEPLHCFDTLKTPYFNQATQTNPFTDYPRLLKFGVLLLGPVTC